MFYKGDILLSAKAIIRKSGKILILKDAYSNFWDLPGGHIKDKETLEEGLKREVKEETGLSITSCKQLLVKQMKLGDETKPVCFYLCDADGEVKLSKEHTDFDWIALKELDDFNIGKFKEYILDSKGKVIKMQPDKNQVKNAYALATWKLKNKGFNNFKQNTKGRDLRNREADKILGKQKSALSPDGRQLKMDLNVEKEVDPAFKEKIADRVPDLKTPLQHEVLGRLKILAEKLEKLLKSSSENPNAEENEHDLSQTKKIQDSPAKTLGFANTSIEHSDKYESKEPKSMFPDKSKTLEGPIYTENIQNMSTSGKMTVPGPGSTGKRLMQTEPIKPALNRTDLTEKTGGVKRSQKDVDRDLRYHKYDKDDIKTAQTFGSLSSNIQNAEEKVLVPVKPIKREQEQAVPNKKPEMLPDEWYKRQVPDRWRIKSVVDRIQKQVLLLNVKDLIQKTEERLLISNFLVEYRNKLILKDQYDNDLRLQILAGKIAKIKGLETKIDILQGIYRKEQLLSKAQEESTIGCICSGAEFDFNGTQSGAVGPMSVATPPAQDLPCLAYPAAIGKQLLLAKKSTCKCTGCNSIDCVSALNKQLLSAEIRKGLDLEQGTNFWNLYDNAVSRGIKSLKNKDLIVLREFLYSRI